MFIKLGRYVINVDHIHSVEFHDAGTGPDGVGYPQGATVVVRSPKGSPTVAISQGDGQELYFEGRDAQRLRRYFERCIQGACDLAAFYSYGEVKQEAGSAPA